jgi:hypothetical protein
MINKIIGLILACGMWFVACGQVYPQDEIDEAQKKAEEIHKFASSDTIYAQEELKAIYYQNMQIIELLKQIRELLAKSLAKEEESQPTK